MDKVKIGFLGYGTRALDSLMAHPMFDVRYFFAPEKRLCRDVYDAQKRYKDCLTMEVVKDNRQLAGRFAEISDADCFLMNACPIILNREVLTKMEVFNIHPGDLRYNRGHHPHCWTVLLGEKKTKVVLHKVSEEIDAGCVIQSVDIEVSEKDSAKDVLNRAENRIPYLLDVLYRHLTEHTAYEMVVENGVYRRAMTYDDYEIHLLSDTKEQMQRKILSRSMHHGAFFLHESKRIYVDELLSCKENQKEQENAVTIQTEKGEKMVYVHSGQRSMVFRLNKTEETGFIHEGKEGVSGEIN